MKPEFVEYETMHQLLKRSRNISMSREQLALHCNERFGVGPDFLRTGFEAMAFANGRPPCFKVWPSVVDMLSGCEFHLPTSCLKMPFSSFVVMLPPNCGMRIENAVTDVRSVLVYWDSPRLGLYPQSEKTRDRIDRPTGILQLEFTDESQDIEDVFRTQVNNTDWKLSRLNDGDIPPDQLESVTTRLFRTILSVAFLAVGEDRLVSPDILSKDFEKYIRARRNDDTSTISRLVKKCETRRGTQAFCVGRDEVHRSLWNNGSDSADGEGRELSFSHQRRAHFRRMQNGIIVFVRQTTVRPDLPPRQNDRVSYSVQ